VLAVALDVIERNGRRQARLIHDLLDVSSIVSGKLRLTALIDHVLTSQSARATVATSGATRICRSLSTSGGRSIS
jgi:hypothetical protein